MERINGKVYLVTGASSGIGEDVCHKLVDEGAIVYGGSRRLPKEYPSVKGKFIPCNVDVTSDESIKAFVSKALAEQGTIYGIINSAGSELCAAMEDYTSKEILDAFDLLVVGPHRLNKEVLPILRENRDGVLINIGSIGGIFPLPYQGPYSMAKAALRKQTEVLRLELKRFNIEAMIIEPGDLRTGFTSARRYASGALDGVYSEELLEAVRRMGEDEQKGQGPECVSRALIKNLKKRHLRANVPVGGIYVFFPFLNRILPYPLVEFILSKMYL